MKLYTLRNSFMKFLELFWMSHSDMYYNMKQPLGIVTPKIWKHKRRWVIYLWWKEYSKTSANEIIGFLLFHMQEDGMQVLLNLWEILVKELLFNNISSLQSTTSIKTKLLTNTFPGFCLVFRNSYLK